ncbi:hypothetical protein DL96DRAFT_1549633 [Flagelloscypha sp. PMI_526]|nr:hypothetical protein DL96DRAFT_1549633 [Flagelloscypha sp. PMI_526]
MVSHISSSELLAAHSTTTVSLSKPFQLRTVDISITHIEPKKRVDFTIPAKVQLVTVVVKGNGSLFCDKSSKVTTYDSFGWGASDAGSRSFSLEADEDSMQVLVYADLPESNSDENALASLPTIVNAWNSVKPNPFPDTVFFCHLFYITRTLPGLSDRWHVNIEIAPPGTKSSDAHAHSEEDEFAFILKGTARYWKHGKDEFMKEGDCVGWVAGTGLAHTLINDGEGDGKGDSFGQLIFGERKHPGDLWWYPEVPEKPKEEVLWTVERGRPEVTWGNAEREPKYPLRKN